MIRDQKGGIKDQNSGTWDHSPRIGYHNPWNQDQEFFEESGIRLYHFCWFRDKNLSYFWCQGSAILVPYYDQELHVIN